MSKVCLLLFPLILCLSASAATIQGTVHDPSGALIAGAAITVTNTVTSETKSTKTDAQGRFTIDGLAPGEYQISVRQQGFEDSARTVTITQEPKLDVSIQLKIQTVETAVEVTGKRSALANADVNYRALRDSGIAEVIRVENVTLQRDVGQLRLRSGLVGFLPAVLGRVSMAVFVGQGSLHLEAATGLEANYLQMRTENKIFDEEFDNLMMTFTDDTYRELTQKGAAVAASPGIEAALRDFHRRMRHRTENPRSMLEFMLADEQIPNVEAELLADLYNANAPPSFSAYIHGHRYRDLRFLIQPRGAMRHLPSPEEVGLIHLDPNGEHEGIFYLTHLTSE
jgi:hypothetical protein